MGHWCLKKSDYMGGWVLSENRLKTIDRYIKWNVPVSIKISNPNLPVFLLCEIIQFMHKLIYEVFLPKRFSRRCCLQVDLKPFT